MSMVWKLCSLKQICSLKQLNHCPSQMASYLATTKAFSLYGKEKEVVWRESPSNLTLSICSSSVQEKKKHALVTKGEMRSCKASMSLAGPKTQTWEPRWSKARTCPDDNVAHWVSLFPDETCLRMENLLSNKGEWQYLKGPQGYRAKSGIGVSAGGIKERKEVIHNRAIEAHLPLYFLSRNHMSRAYRKKNSTSMWWLSSSGSLSPSTAWWGKPQLLTSSSVHLTVWNHVLCK